MSYRLSQDADNDLTAIYLHGREMFGRVQAEAYYADLIARFEFLAENPRAARERSDMDPPVRVHPSGAHVIIYQLEGSDIVVLGVRHGAKIGRTEAEPANDYFFAAAMTRNM